jgi:hypothetical protein
MRTLIVLQDSDWRFHGAMIPPNLPSASTPQSIGPLSARQRQLADLQSVHHAEQRRPIDPQAAKRMLVLREAAQEQPKNKMNRITGHFKDPDPNSRSGLYDQAMEEYFSALSLTPAEIAADRKAALKAGMLENAHAAMGRLLTGSTAAAGPAGLAVSQPVNHSVGFLIAPFTRATMRTAAKPAMQMLQQGGGTTKLAPNIAGARNPEEIRADMKALRKSIRADLQVLDQFGPPGERGPYFEELASPVLQGLHEKIGRAEELNREYVDSNGATQNRMIGKAYGTAASTVGNAGVLTAAIIAPPFAPLAAAGSAGLAVGAGSLDYRNKDIHAQRLNMKHADILTRPGKEKIAAGAGHAELAPSTDIDAGKVKALRTGPITARVAGAREIAYYKLSRYQMEIRNLRNPSGSDSDGSSFSKKMEKWERLRHVKEKRDGMVRDLNVLQSGNWSDLNPDGHVARALTSDAHYFANNSKAQFDKPGEFKANLAESYYQRLQTAAIPLASIGLDVPAKLDSGNSALLDAGEGFKVMATTVQSPSGFPTDNHKNTVSKPIMGDVKRGMTPDQLARLNEWKNLPGTEGIDLSKTGGAYKDAQPSFAKRFSHGMRESAGGFLASLKLPIDVIRAKRERAKLNQMVDQARNRLALEETSPTPGHPFASAPLVPLQPRPLPPIPVSNAPFPVSNPPLQAPAFPANPPTEHTHRYQPGYRPASSFDIPPSRQPVSAGPGLLPNPYGSQDMDAQARLTEAREAVRRANPGLRLPDPESRNAD